MFQIYNIEDFTITHEASALQRVFSFKRAGEIKDRTLIPDCTHGQSENFWHILPCGDRYYSGEKLYSFEFAIVEHFVAAIYRLVLGYNADTLIIYDREIEMFCRASRNIKHANTWSPKKISAGCYSLVDPIDKYRIQVDGRLLDDNNQSHTLYGLATISVISFLLADGDVHDEQYMLQDLPLPKVWRIDHQYAFRADYPVTQENLQALPYFESEGYLQKFCMTTNLSPLITQADDFQREKLMAMKTLYNSHSRLVDLLNSYCSVEKYDEAVLNNIFTAEELQQLPQRLDEIKIRFGKVLDRINSPKVKEFIESHPIAQNHPKLHL